MRTLLHLTQISLNALVLKVLADCLDTIAEEMVPPSQELPPRRLGRLCREGSMKMAFLDAINVLLPKVGFGSPAGAILQDLQQYILVGSSRTAAQRRRANRRGRVWASVNHGLRGLPGSAPISFCSANRPVIPSQLAATVAGLAELLVAERQAV